MIDVSDIMRDSKNIMHCRIINNIIIIHTHSLLEQVNFGFDEQFFGLLHDHLFTALLWYFRFTVSSPAAVPRARAACETNTQTQTT